MIVPVGKFILLSSVVYLDFLFIYMYVMECSILVISPIAIVYSGEIFIFFFKGNLAQLYCIVPCPVCTCMVGYFNQIICVLSNTSGKY